MAEHGHIHMIPQVTETREVIDMMGGRFEVAARFGAGDDATIMLRTQQPPGRLVPLHDHSPECIYILSGTLEVWTELPEPGWKTLGPGQSMYLDDMVKHALRNTGDVPVDFLLLIDGRLAQFFRDAGNPADLGSKPRPPTPDAIKHVSGVARSYGWWIASPAEAEAIIGPSGVPAAYLTQPDHGATDR